MTMDWRFEQSEKHLSPIESLYPCKIIDGKSEHWLKQW
jgi:hypothetical protein